LHRKMQMSGIVILLISVGMQGCQRERGAATALSNGNVETVAVQAQADAWSKAISVKDLEKTLSFYAADGQYLPAGRAAASTSDERRKLWVEDYGTPGFASEEITKKIEVARSGDLAYQLGTYTLTVRAEKGKRAHSTGKFVVVWKKQADGEWKAIADIDNADN
jgi:ketosteroid isomerase-like protein